MAGTEVPERVNGMALELIEALDPSEVIDLMDAAGPKPAFPAAPAAPPPGLDAVVDGLRAWYDAHERALRDAETKLADAERRLKDYEDMKRELQSLVSE